METTTSEQQQQQKPVRPKRVREKIVVKYIEHNGWEQEIWRNYYMFAYSSKLIKQFELLNKFMDVFDEHSKVDFNLTVRASPYLTLHRTYFELKICRKFKNDDKSLRALQKESHLKSRHAYKKSHFYSFAGKELPHYREIAAFLKKHDISDGEMFKPKLEELLKTDGVFNELEALFYKQFGNYKEAYGKGKKVYETESESSGESEADTPFSGGGFFLSDFINFR